MSRLQETLGSSSAWAKAFALLKSNVWRIAVSLYLAIVIILLFFTMITTFHYNHYYFQALSWLHGSNDIDGILSQPERSDLVFYQGHVYMPLGPLPAALVLPVVALLGKGYQPWMVIYPLVVLSVAAAWRTLQRLQVNESGTRFWLLALFFLGTVYFTTIMNPGPWYMAHLITCWFLFLGIDESLGKNRPWLIGLYVGFAAATRFTALFTLPYFLILLARQETLPVALRFLARRLVLVGLGLAIPMIFYFGFNLARFGNIFETGYGISIMGPGTDVATQARDYGLFSPVHIPKNLYYLFLAGPLPNGPSLTHDPADSPILTFPYLKPSIWGLSIFLTTPAVIYAVRANRRSSLVVACWAAIICTAIPILIYYGIGIPQFGYRYALDFMPFVWVLIVLALRDKLIGFRQPGLAFWLIVVGIVVNFGGVFWLLNILPW